eukprot:361241-Chlamydomonas_euryale.AAC.2
MPVTRTQNVVPPTNMAVLRKPTNRTCSLATCFMPSAAVAACSMDFLRVASSFSRLHEMPDAASKSLTGKVGSTHTA